MPDNKNNLGAEKLRALRKKMNIAQLDIELDAGLGAGSLTLMELGKRQPKKATLERILEVLNAKYNERKAILEGFGYTANTPLPTDEEIDWACLICQPIIDDSPVPAYLIDCATRVLATNKFIPLINSFLTGSPQMENLFRRPLLEIVYDETHPLKYMAMVENELSPLTKSLCAVLVMYQQEEWCQQMLERAAKKLPTFKQMWQEMRQTEQPEVIDYRSRFMNFNMPSLGKLQFFRHIEYFASDSRFRLIHWLPAERHTIDLFEKMSANLNVN